ncbi:MAG: amidohydrolase family protein [Anaerolineae bacterium]
MLSIVDSHAHFWDTGYLSYPWLQETPFLNRPFLPDHVPAGGADYRIDRIVFVQADCLPNQGIAEADWVSRLAESDPRISGIVAFAPLEYPDAAAPILETLSLRPLVKGIRRLIQSEPLGFSVQPAFVQGVQMLAEYGFACDLCIKHPQLPDVIGLVRQCPNVRFVLDHIGKPDIKNHVLEPWRQNIAALAAMPNVWCKISGLVTEADTENWTAEDLRPYIDAVIESFGVERVMFGSDAPVAYLATTYNRWVETLRDATSGLPAADQERLFAANATQFYSLSRIHN